MGKIKKGRPKPHVVIADTSTLWHEDKSHVVAPDFDEFWRAYGDQYGLELVIPEVVRGELVFQQVTSAVKSLKRANQAIGEVAGVTRRKYSHRITEQRVLREVESKFDRWVQGKSAKVLGTPTNVIVWAEVVRKSIWREPPFVFDQQDGDNEKGFRDCLILETVRHFCTEERRDVLIAFLCKDKLLKQSVENALCADKRVSTYELISDFTTYLDLTREQLEDVFIKAIVIRATEKFFTRGDAACLYLRDNVPKILREKYRSYFEDPEESEKESLEFLLGKGLRKWDPVGSGTFWVARSQFVETDADGQYVWLSLVTYVRQYDWGEGAGLSGDKAEAKRRRILVLPFEITWRARVTADGRFWEYSYVGDALKGNTFREVSDEDRKTWQLEEAKG